MRPSISSTRSTRFERLMLALVVALALVTALRGQQSPISSVGSGSSLATPVSIANGGTGQATATLGFNALSPVTTRGDLIYRDATNNARLAKGTSGQFLSIGANDPVWAAVPLGFVPMAGGAAAGWSPVAATIYYFVGNLTANPATTDANVSGVRLPVAGTLRAATFFAQIFGTKGTVGQNVTIAVRLNHTTDIAIGSGDWSAQENNVAATGLSQAFTATDVYSIKITTPAVWTTTPTVVFVQAMLYFDQP